jgi:glycosyltransferase involved in cell wall biosynthesis
VQQGVPAEKLVVIPLCYEEEKGEGKREKGKSSCHPLRVLFLGQVILRKGIQYLMEAARQLEGENMRFEVVGPIGISEQALKSAPKNMMFHGRVSRDQASDWYRRADVFVLPTISDGFALTQLEAMAHGLPVITTANCGDVVRHGLDGRIVPPRDAHALAEAIMTFANDRSSLSDFSQNAQRRVKDFSLRKLGNDLLEVEKALSE